MSLERFGWNTFFARAFDPYAEAGFRAGRVCRAVRGHYDVLTADGDLAAGVSGRFRYRIIEGSEWPVAGDWVALTEGTPRIEAVLPRKTKFSRKQPGAESSEQMLAANIEVLFIVTGLDSDFSPRRLERYLTLAREGGARPVVILNKTDLCADLGEAVRRTESVSAGAPVVPMSASSGEGTNVLGRHLAPGETAALTGSSGVGKSTIVNRLLGFEAQRTGEVREYDHKGRHTTTRRELIVMREGWLLLDMPGLREIQLWADEPALEQAFSDVSELAGGCRFRDCRHEGEPGCALASAATETGGVEDARLRSYLKLRREMQIVSGRRDKRAAAEKRRIDKRIHRMFRDVPHR